MDYYIFVHSFVYVGMQTDFCACINKTYTEESKYIQYKQDRRPNTFAGLETWDMKA